MPETAHEPDSQPERWDEYQEYFKRNTPESPDAIMEPLSYEEWLAWRREVEKTPDEPEPERIDIQVQDNDEPVPLEPDSSSTSTGGEANVRFSHTVSPVIAPVFNNNPNIHIVGGGAGASERSGERPPGAGERPPGGGEQPQGLEALKEAIDALTARIEALEERLNNPPEPEPEPDPRPARLEQAQAQETEAKQALVAARSSLIEYTIRRKARTGDGFTSHRREDASSYSEAMRDYREALNNYLRARKAVLELQENANPANIASEILRARAQELIDFETAEVQINNEQLQREINDRMNGGFFNRMRGRRLRLMRWWANKSTVKKVIIGALAGTGIGVASAALGAGLFGVVVGAAYRASMGLTSREASMRNVSEHSKNQRIKGIEKARDRTLRELQRRGNLTDQELEAFLSGQVDQAEGHLTHQVRWAQRRNKIGTAAIMLGTAGSLYGIADLAGGTHYIAPKIGEEIHHANLGRKLHRLEGLWPFGHHHGGASGGGVETAPGINSTPGAGIGLAPEQVSHLRPDTIYASNMTEFQYGVAKLLNEQGVRVNMSPSVVHHMNQYMMHRSMASGVGEHGQHIISGESVFNNPSHAQGFADGSDGTGHQELLNWMAEARKAGATFESTTG